MAFDNCKVQTATNKLLLLEFVYDLPFISIFPVHVIIIPLHPTLITGRTGKLLIVRQKKMASVSLLNNVLWYWDVFDIR